MERPRISRLLKCANVTLSRDYPTIEDNAWKEIPSYEFWGETQGKDDTHKLYNSLLTNRILLFYENYFEFWFMYLIWTAYIWYKWYRKEIGKLLRHLVGHLPSTKIINSNIVGINAYILSTSTVNIKFRGVPRNAVPNFFSQMCQIEAEL